MTPIFEQYLGGLRRELLGQGISERTARELVEECAFHLCSACEALEASGLTPDQAASETLRRFGGATDLATAWASAERTAPPRWCWVLVCILGLGLGLIVSLPVGRWVGSALGMLLILPSIGWVIGMILGLSQGWALRQRLTWLIRWGIGTALGCGVGVTAGTTLVESLGLERSRPVDELLGLLLIGLIAGAAQALAQWRLVRRSLAGAQRWIVVHGLGTGAGLALGNVAARLMGLESGPPELALTLLGGIAAAAWAASAELDRLLAAPARTA